VKLCIKFNIQCYRIGCKAYNYILIFFMPDGGTFGPKHVAYSEEVIVFRNLHFCLTVFLLVSGLYKTQWGIIPKKLFAYTVS